MKLTKARLILEDGSVFFGKSFGFESSVAGEVVFNTGMTGYPESLTDPSYAGQILVLTYPLIGNYGVPGDEQDEASGLLENFESDKAHITGLVVSDYSFEHSHWNAKKSLSEWLVENKVPALFDIDTRMLTKMLREKGTMLGRIVFDKDERKEKGQGFFDPNKENLVKKVSISEKKIYRGRGEVVGRGVLRVVLVDCGVKNNIIRCFLKRGVEIVRVPWNYDFLGEEYDGLFISNGPGDPKACKATIANLKKSLDANDPKPVFGICLGNQLLALACGADTYKLKYGHRGQNQPAVMHTDNKHNRCFITSQNHGFAVDSESLPEGWEVLFSNANDGTCEGIRHVSKPFFSCQFHPEAACGPTDTEFLFDDFLEEVRKHKRESGRSGK
ncbi:glutamine-hydrolyzing carbamoyl-phosphate synthase small subunit [Candidatus Woesearchaeota archaeon]|nr:glutamine-hydrolyzing carbamoyl-phosphate synthase small subunit [Candidatus Woesearchaeota archaeon]